jgi:hypothetical protein
VSLSRRNCGSSTIACALVVLVAGCGRLGYEQRSYDGPIPRDAAPSDAAPSDAARVVLDGCFATDELCNGADDDCDGPVDEGVCGGDGVLEVHQLSSAEGATNGTGIALAPGGRIIAVGTARGALSLDRDTPIGTVSSGIAKMFALSISGGELEAGIHVDASSSEGGGVSLAAGRARAYGSFAGSFMAPDGATLTARDESDLLEVELAGTDLEVRALAYDGQQLDPAPSVGPTATPCFAFAFGGQLDTPQGTWTNDSGADYRVECPSLPAFWQRFGGTTNHELSGVSFDGTSVVVTVNHYTPLVVGDSELTADATDFRTNGFIGAFGADRTILWNHAADGSSPVTIEHPVPDGSGGVWVHGTIGDGVTIAGRSVPQAVVGLHSFIAHFDRDGALLTLRNAADSGAVFVTGLVYGADGPIAAATVLDDTASFGVDEYAASQAPVFVVRYDASGEVVSTTLVANRTISLYRDALIARDGAGRLAIMGQFSGNLTLPGQPMLSPAGMSGDLFIAVIAE